MSQHYAVNDTQYKMLEHYIQSFKSGKLSDHRDSSRFWTNNRSLVVQMRVHTDNVAAVAVIFCGTSWLDAWRQYSATMLIVWHLHLLSFLTSLGSAHLIEDIECVSNARAHVVLTLFTKAVG
jgi:hypothetical protein